MGVHAVAAIARHPIVFATLSVTLLLVVAANLVPPPRDWAKSPDARSSDVTITQQFDWHPFLGAWTLESPRLDVKPATWVNTRAWATNELSFGFTSSQNVVYTLTDANGRTIQERSGSTGSATPLTDHNTDRVVFRTIDLGQYQVHVRVVNDAGSTLTETARSFGLVHAGGISG